MVLLCLAEYLLQISDFHTKEGLLGAVRHERFLVPASPNASSWERISCVDIISVFLIAKNGGNPVNPVISTRQNSLQMIYLLRVVDDWDDDRYQDFAQNEWRYKTVLRNRINQLAEAYSREKFKEWLDTGKVFCKPSWALPINIEPSYARKHGEFSYFMVFENNPIDDALRVEDLRRRIQEM